MRTLCRVSALVHAVVLTAVAVSLAVDIATVVRYPTQLSVYPNLQVDAASYDALARAVVASKSLAPVPPFQPPGFIAFVAGIYGLVGHSLVAVKVTLCGLAAATALVVGWFARRVLGPWEAVVSALLIAWSPALHAYVGTLQYEVLAAFLIALALVATEIGAAQRSLAWLLAGAVLSGLVVLTREAAALIIPVVALRGALGWRAHGTGRDRVVGIAATLVAVQVIVIGGWVAYQSAREGRLVPVSEKGPAALAFGNNPLADGSFNAPLVGTPAPSGWAFVRQQPARALVLAARRAGYFWGVLSDEWVVPDRSPVYLSRATLGTVDVAHAGHALRWWPLAAFLAGAVMLWRHPAWPSTWTWPATVLAVMLAPVLTVSSSRFSVPVLPEILLVSAVPVAALLRGAARYRAALVAAGLVAVWCAAAQMAQRQGGFELAGAQLLGRRAANADDSDGGRRNARFAAAAPGPRAFGIWPEQPLPGGWILLVAEMRAPIIASSPVEPEVALGRFTVSSRHDVLCAAPFTTRHLRAATYVQVPMRCELSRDATVTILLDTTGATDLWLSNLSVRYGYRRRGDAVLDEK